MTDFKLGRALKGQNFSQNSPLWLMSLGMPDEKRWIDRMNSFGTKSVLWIKDLTTFKESVLFAHTLLLHWSNIYYQNSFYLHLISRLIENGIRISNLMMFCLDLIKFLKDKHLLWKRRFLQISLTFRDFLALAISQK